MLEAKGGMEEEAGGCCCGRGNAAAREESGEELETEESDVRLVKGEEEEGELKDAVDAEGSGCPAAGADDVNIEGEEKDDDDVVTDGKEAEAAENEAEEDEEGDEEGKENGAEEAEDVSG